LNDSNSFRLPDVAPPFVTVQRINNAVGLTDRNRPHYHPDSIEFCAVLRGQLDWFMGDESYTAHPGETLVIPAEVVHGSIDANLQPCDLVVAHLAPEQLPERLAAVAQSLEARRLSGTDAGTLVQRILEEHARASPFRDEVVAALGVLLVASVAEFEASDEERRNSLLIRQAKRAMIGKGGVRPTVDDVANRLGVSSVWLHKLFVRETGVSPGDWARGKRLSEAKRLLEEGQMSTVAIAMHLGYASGQSFATAFRRESGMTPSEYRAFVHESESARERTVYRVEMRETWENGVRLYPPV
jgi:AraC-like DNA-binding protein